MASERADAGPGAARKARTSGRKGSTSDVMSNPDAGGPGDSTGSTRGGRVRRPARRQAAAYNRAGVGHDGSTPMRTFVRTVGSASEQPHIDLTGTRLTITSGPADPRTEDDPDAVRARAAHDARIAEWLRAGFVETAAPAVPLRQ